MIQRFRIVLFVLSLAAGLASAGSALAGSSTLTTSGTSTSTGTVKITIEDFNKPGWVRLLSTSSVIDSDSTGMTIVVQIPAGANCARISDEIMDELVEHLPGTFVVTIFPEQPCTVFISCDAQSCNGWAITKVESDVPGITITVAEEGVPVEPATWSRLKSLNWRAPGIRLR